MRPPILSPRGGGTPAVRLAIRNSGSPGVEHLGMGGCGKHSMSDRTIRFSKVEAYWVILKEHEQEGKAFQGPKLCGSTAPPPHTEFSCGSRLPRPALV